MKQKQSKVRTCLQNILQSRENSNACAPINTVSRSGTQSTHILERITDKTAGKRPAGAAAPAAGAAGAAGGTAC